MKERITSTQTVIKAYSNFENIQGKVVNQGLDYSISFIFLFVDFLKIFSKNLNNLDKS